MMITIICVTPGFAVRCVMGLFQNLSENCLLQCVGRAGGNATSVTGYPSTTAWENSLGRHIPVLIFEENSVKIYTESSEFCCGLNGILLCGDSCWSSILLGRYEEHRNF